MYVRIYTSTKQVIHPHKNQSYVRTKTSHTSTNTSRTSTKQVIRPQIQVIHLNKTYVHKTSHKSKKQVIHPQNKSYVQRTSHTSTKQTIGSLLAIPAPRMSHPTSEIWRPIGNQTSDLKCLIVINMAIFRLNRAILILYFVSRNSGLVMSTIQSLG
uniref:Uncharacterized protein n=1 Tax=Cacopsylla melanoneura TaxID=428564 RepID=A0A8D8QUY6_9HEMI